MQAENLIPEDFGCYVRQGTQDLTRATVASNCIPRIMSCDTDAETEEDQPEARQAQEHHEKKERQRINGQPP